VSVTLQEQVNAAVMELQKTIQNVTLDELAAVCSEGIRTTSSLVQELATRLVRLVSASLGVVNSLVCENIVPLYVSASARLEGVCLIL
jgi:hypothetical protein